MCVLVLHDFYALLSLHFCSETKESLPAFFIIGGRRLGEGACFSFFFFLLLLFLRKHVFVSSGQKEISTYVACTIKLCNFDGQYLCEHLH